MTLPRGKFLWKTSSEVFQVFGEGGEENIRGEALLPWSRHSNRGMWGDVHGKTCPIGAISGFLLLLVQLMLSPVCFSHKKVEVARVDGEEARASSGVRFVDGDGGLSPVLVGLICSSVTTVHRDSTFLLPL